MHSFIMATHLKMSAQDNVKLIKLSEEFNVKLARERKFKAVFTTNTSETTRVSFFFKEIFFSFEETFIFFFKKTFFFF